jgi:hypothetical protein
MSTQTNIPLIVPVEGLINEQSGRNLSADLQNIEGILSVRIELKQKKIFLENDGRPSILSRHAETVPPTTADAEPL